MVLEILVDPKKISGKPWEMFFIGAMYSLFGFALGYWIFKGYVTLIMVTFTTIASVPFFHKAIELEEAKETESTSEVKLLEEHGKVVSMFTFLFLGFVTVFSLLYIVLPNGIVEEVFKAQIETIVRINASPTGAFIASFKTFVEILSNNLKILALCLAFSFFYGVGALFILAWNASVMGAAIGDAIRSGLHNIVGIGGYFHVISTNVLGYFLHGVPEIVAYFIAALAGGIISVATIREKFGSEPFIKTMLDSIDLVLISFVLLVIAGLIEVFVSPSVG